MSVQFITSHLEQLLSYHKCESWMPIHDGLLLT